MLKAEKYYNAAVKAKEVVLSKSESMSINDF